MPSTRIASTTPESLVSLGAAGQRSFELLRGVLLAEFGERHAGLLAEPVGSPDGEQTDWYSEGGEASLLIELPETEQAVARDALGRLLADIQNLAARIESRGGPNDRHLSEALRNLLEVPDERCIYVQRRDGFEDSSYQPVLVNWAHRRDTQAPVESVLTTMVPRRPPPGPPPAPPAPPVAAVIAPRTAFPWWLVWWLGWILLGFMIAYLLWLLILPCGVRTPFGGNLNFCPAAVFAEANGAAARRVQLESEIAEAELRIAILQGQCQAQAAVPEPPPPAPPPPVEEPADEIEERLEREDAQRGELSFSLAWNSLSDLDLYAKCPSGDEIYYGDKIEENWSCAGELDVDANLNHSSSTREPVENIWFTHAANGRYRITVKQHASRGVSTNRFTLRIQDGGRIETITGAVNNSNRVWTHIYQRTTE